MVVSDAEKYKSSQMNEVCADAAETCADGVKILFIGNSITIHAILPKIGWFGEWGMAASSKENDYVHLVIRGIERETGRPADARIRNLADFERGLLDYDHERDRDLIDFQPDYLVFAPGENVPALESDAEPQRFRKAFRKLVEEFLSGKKKPHIVIRGVFWPNEWKDEIMSQTAAELGLTFVKADIAENEGMMALGKFEHNGVQRHPGDKGMKEIANRILAGFFPHSN